MELKNQVVSLKLAKKMKELGFEQESAFYWVITLTTDYHLSFYDNDLPQCLKERNDCYSAYTVAELGKMLPSYYFSEGRRYKIYCDKDELTDDWIIKIINNEKEVECGFADTEADGRAKCLIYLVEKIKLLL